MKKIISGDRPYLKLTEIKFVDVPLYDELQPSNVIKQMKLKEKGKEESWKALLQYCPELSYKEQPKDRDFFYNVLNTIIPNCVTKIAYNAEVMRQTKSRIENEITVAPEFRDIFTNKFSLLGSKGRTIK